MKHRRRPRAIRKIVLIEPKPPDIHIFSHFALPRLGVVLLGTILRDQGYDVTVMVEESKPFDFDAIVSADLVGISSITPTAGRAYTIGDRLRARGVPVVMGGPHPTHIVEESLQHCDWVIRGEGEAALPALLTAIKTGSPLSEVPNLSYWRDGQIIDNPQAPLDPDLDQWPDPDMSLVEGFDAHGFIGNARRVVPIQTSRGCPYDCSFCSVTKTFGRKMRYRSPERVVAEMARHDLDKTVFFIYDDNFAASPKHTKEMLAAFRTLPKKPRWSAQVRADVARDAALLDEMAETGCDTVFIGLESVNQESLNTAEKRQDLAVVEEHLTAINQRGINIHGMFVFGFDTDDAGTMERTVQFAKRNRLFSVQFLILTPLPGSRTHREMNDEGRMVLHDYSLFDAHHVVFRPSKVTPAELMHWQVEGHRQFYTIGEAFKRLLDFKPIGFFLILYARRINKQWQRVNAEYLQVIERLSHPCPTPPEEYARAYPELADEVNRAIRLAG